MRCNIQVNAPFVVEWSFEPRWRKIEMHIYDKEGMRNRLRTTKNQIFVAYVRQKKKKCAPCPFVSNGRFAMVKWPLKELVHEL